MQEPSESAIPCIPPALLGFKDGFTPCSGAGVKKRPPLVPPATVTATVSPGVPSCPRPRCARCQPSPRRGRGTVVTHFVIQTNEANGDSPQPAQCSGLSLALPAAAWMENCWGSRERRELSSRERSVSPRSGTTRCDPASCCIPGEGSSPGSCSVGKIPQIPPGWQCQGWGIPPCSPRATAQRFPRMWGQPGSGNDSLPTSIITLLPGAKILIHLWDTRLCLSIIHQQPKSSCINGTPSSASVKSQQQPKSSSIYGTPGSASL